VFDLSYSQFLVSELRKPDKWALFYAPKIRHPDPVPHTVFKCYILRKLENVKFTNMQLHLPIFPVKAKSISSTVAVFTHDGLIHYFANGLPFYSHGPDEMDAFSHVVCLLIEQGLCRRCEVVQGFCVTDDYVGKSLRIFRKQGHSGLYNLKRKKNSSKLFGQRLVNIQDKLDQGQSVNSIAKEEGVSEGSIRYQISQNNLKKKI